MKRIPPSRKLRQEIEEVLQGYEWKGHPLDAFVTSGARYMLQVALEQEVEDFLGRALYCASSSGTLSFPSFCVASNCASASRDALASRIFFSLLSLKANSFGNSSPLLFLP